MSKIVIFAVMALAMGVIVARLADRNGRAESASSAMAVTSAAEPANAYNARTVTLSRGNGGHFWTEARIDGRRLELVVDTGASAIALRESDAARLGIHPSMRDYNVK